MDRELTECAEARGIPLRTVDDVRTALTEAKATNADAEMASLMLKFGRLTEEARQFVAAWK